jgi:hypothetical protein
MQRGKRRKGYAEMVEKAIGYIKEFPRAPGGCRRLLGGGGNRTLRIYVGANFGYSRIFSDILGYSPMSRAFLFVSNPYL